jgi:serine/threonine protein kinase
MEYLPLGDISQCFKKRLPEWEVKDVSKQLLDGLKKMHEVNIAHRDIKPAVS